MSVHIIFEMQLKAEAAEGFAASIATALVDTRKYEGCERVNVYRDAADANRFVLIEQWRSKADYESYIAWRTSTGMMDQLGSTMQSPPVLRYLNLVA